MELLLHRAARRVGLALLWLLGSLATGLAAPAGLLVRPWPASAAHVLAGNISRAEYFVDADPGLGNGTAIPLTPGADVSGLTYTVNLSALTTGFHRLSTRTQDVGGVWSLTNTRSFYYQAAAGTTSTLANIVKAEYFIDAEPGFGNGVDIPVATPATDVSGLGFTVNLSTLTNGFHRISTRTRDANGLWSITNTRSFYYQNAATTGTPALANIVKAEYFIDAEPGFGNGVDIPVASPSSDVSGLAFVVNLASLTNGFHRLSTRSRDANGLWSITNTRSFYYQNATTTTPPLANIVKAEYFIDAEPGFGNGVDIPVASPSPDVSGLAFVVNLSTLTNGFHRLSTRSRDANGLWSITNTRSFYYLPASAIPGPPANITRVEYYFDTDPGFGSGTSVPIATPASDVTVGYAADLSVLSNGAHRLFLRSRDADGKWSLVSNTAFTKSNCASAPSYATGLPAASYVATNSGNPNSLASAAFNTDPAAPTQFNSPIFTGTGTLQADLGTVQTISEVRVRLTPASTNNTVTVTTQTAATTAGPFTTIDTYVAPLVANTPLLVARPLATPVSARVVRFQFQSSFSNYVVVSGAGIFNFACVTPSITSVAPNTGPVGTSVTITGANLQGTTVLTFAGASSNTVSSGFTVSTDGTQITGVVVPGGAATGNLTATSPNGTSNGVNFTVIPGPALTSISPASGIVGSTVTLNGTGLTGATVVTFAGTASNTVTSGYVVNGAGTQITGIVVPGGAATGNVSVTTPGGTSNGVNFTVTLPIPALTSLNPTSGPVGTSVTISGTNLSGATSVSFNGTVQTSITSNTANSLVVAVPSGATTGNVTVTTPNGTSNGLSFTVTAPQLVVSQGSTTYPSNGTAYGFGNQPRNTSSAPVAFTLSNPGAAPLTISSVTATGNFGLSGATPAGVAAGGTATVGVVFTPTAIGPRTGSLVIVSNAGTYTLNLSGTGTAPLPTITSFTPTTGVAGTLVNISGTDLDGATAVTFNGTAAGPISNNTVSGLTVSAPAGGTDGPICVTTAGGTACSGTSYLYPPTLATGTISGSSFCTGNTLTVPFSTNTSRYATGNVFNFQLSDASGVFAANAPLLGTLQSSNATGGVLTGAIPQATPAGSGYRVRVVASNPAVTGADNGANLTIGTTPVSQAAGPASVANGAPINLSVSPTYPGATYAWSGPGGFSSTLASPTASTTTAGTARYNLTVTLGTCSYSSFVDVNVLPSTDPTLTMTAFNGPICLEASRTVSFAVSGNPFPAGNVITAQLSDASGSFGAPVSIGSVSFSGQGNGSVSITIPAGTTPGTGYRVRLVGSNPSTIVSNDNGSNITLNGLPTVTATSNSPVAQGGTIVLNGGPAVTGNSYVWTAQYTGGGSATVGTTQNLSLTNATPAQSGNYTLTITNAAGCSASASTPVTVNAAAPVTTLTLNALTGPLCAGTGYTLGYTAGGPNFNAGNTITAQLSDASGSFASAVAIGSVSTTAATNGTLGVTIPASASGSGYRIRLVSSSPAIVSNDNGSALTITNLSAVSAGSNSPVASGGTISLTATGISGATYAWTGPNGYTASGPNQNIGSATTTNGGTYAVTVSLNGCSTTVSTTVVVNPPVASIQTAGIAGSYCARTPISVPFTAANFTAGNVFTAELSNASGSFASPVSLGTLTGTSTGTIAGFLPANTPAGTGYRIRVVGSQPATIGADNGTDLTITAAGLYTWLGTADTNWNNPANWSCSQVPDSTSTVMIPGGLSRYPALGAGFFPLTNLTVASGATMTLAGNLYLKGNLTNNGTLNGTGGSLICGGPTAQVISGNSMRFLNLTLNNPAGVTLQTALGLHRVLQLNLGNLASNGNLTLESDATGTAMVVNKAGGGVVTGAATAQRYVSPALNSGLGYRHFAAPVDGATITDLRGTGAPAPVVNALYNTVGNTVTPYPTVFSYDEQRLTATGNTTFDQGWQSPANLSDPLTAGRGFTVNLAPATLSLTGTLRTGPYAVTMTRGATANSGWQLLGNPYPAPLNWNNLTRPGNMDNALYVYQSSGQYAGSYVSYVNGMGPAGANLVASGQAFFGRMGSAGTATLTFTNAARETTYSSPVQYRTTANRPVLELALQASAAGSPADVLYVYQETGATAAFDSYYDALKVVLNGGQQPTLYQQAGPESLSIQGLPEGTQPQALPLGVNAPTAGAFVFRPQRLDNFPATTTLYLEDRLTGTWHNLRTGAYTTTLAQGLSTARFVLHLNPAAGPLATTASAQPFAEMQVYPNPAASQTATVQVVVSGQATALARAHLEVLNSIGQRVYSAAGPATVPTGSLRLAIPTAGLAAGVYTVRLTTATGVLTRKLSIN